MDDATKAIVSNRHVLDLISGDTMGSPAYPVYESGDGNMQLFFSQLVNGSFAAALVNWGEGAANSQSIDFETFFVDERSARNASYDVYDLWDGVDFEKGTVPMALNKMSGSPFKQSITGLDVPSHGIRLLRLVPAGTDGMGISEEEKRALELEDAEHVRLERTMQWQNERVQARRVAGKDL